MEPKMPEDNSMRKFRKVATTTGLAECRSLKSCYLLQVDGDSKVILAAHMKDLIWTCEEGFVDEVEKILGCFEFKKIEEGNVRFCGRDYSQGEDYYGIKMPYSTDNLLLSASAVSASSEFVIGDNLTINKVSATSNEKIFRHGYGLWQIHDHFCQGGILPEQLGHCRGIHDSDQYFDRTIIENFEPANQSARVHD